MCCGRKHLGVGKLRAETKVGVCDVCKITENDTSEKQVEFCSFCGAWICKKCQPKIIKRGWAAIKNQLNF